MKKLNYLLLGLTGLTLASCSQDDLLGEAKGDGNFNITVKLPADMGSRADNLMFGNGLTADNLHYVVYEVTNEPTDGTPAELSEALIEGTASFGGQLQTDLSLNLINGKSYQIAFFAVSEAGESVYTMDTETNKITVNYGAMDTDANNVDAYDCFYKLYPTGTISPNGGSHKVELKRPVAQINWGTNDMNLNKNVIQTWGQNGAYVESTINTTVYTEFDMITGEAVATSSENLTLPAFTVPDIDVYNYPVEPATYKYVAMQYILVPADETLSNMTLNITNTNDNPGAKEYTNTVEVNNAPVQANYRTNIYGSLLTNPTNFTVVKNPIFDGQYNVPLVWDGSKTFPQVVDGEMSINQPSDLAGLAAMVSGTDGQSADDFDGVTVKINADLDMNGIDFPTIGNASKAISEYNPFGTIEGNTFKGTIDGQNHTISNLQISAAAGETAALLPVVEGGTIENLNFENVELSGTAANQTGIVGLLTDNGSVRNVNVKGTVNGGNYTGGVVGVIVTKGSVSDCNNNATVNGTKYVGGVVGAAMYCTEGYNMSVTNCHNTGTITGDAKAKYVGGVIGMSSAVVSNCSNTAAVSSGLNSTGGVVGEQRNAGSVTGCTNSGDVTMTNTTDEAAGAGGVVGWVRYWNYSLATGGFENEESEITVSGNTNYGSVKGWLYVGGIVGQWYYGGQCLDNNNYASSISAGNQFASGIVGTQQVTGNQTNVPTWSPGANAKLDVKGNKTSTTLENITSAQATNLVDLVMYVNTASAVEVNNNQTGVEQQFPPQN